MERKITEKALELSQQTLYELDAIQEFLDTAALVGKTEDEASKMVMSCFYGDAGFNSSSFWRSTACFDYAMSEMRRRTDEHKSPNMADLSRCPPSVARPNPSERPINRAQRRALRNKR